MKIILDHNILKKVSTPVESVEEAKDIINKLEETLALYENGIGLSAIQIGIPKRVFILKTDEGFTHFVNPIKISEEEEFIFHGEGCLSFPSIYLDTKRFCEFTLKYHLIEDDTFIDQTVLFYYSPNKEDRSDGILAIAAQHEYDHQDGRIIIEHGKEGLATVTRIGEKVGRNDPCPCGKKDGNGKPIKYKKCCLN